MNRKVLLISIIVVTLISGVFFSCADSTTSTSSTTQNSDWPKNISIGVSGGEMGPTYALFAGLGTMIQKYLNVNVNITATSGWENASLMQANKIQMFEASSYSVGDILKGTGPVKEIGPVACRAFLQQKPMTCELIVLNSSGIKSISDLKNKRIGVIRPQRVPIGEAMLKPLLSIYNLKYDQDVKIIYWDEASEAYSGLKTGKFECIWVLSSLPSSANNDLFLSQPGQILNLSDSDMEKVQQSVTYLVKQTIPGGTYKNMDKNIQTLGLATFLVCSKDLPESFVYSMTKMVWDKNNEFITYHPQCKDYKAADVVKVVPISPYHPGAIKYYREVGIWNKDLDNIQNKILSSL